MNATNMSLTEVMEMLSPYLPLIIPLAIAQFALMLFAILHIVSHRNYKTGNMAVWIIIVLLVNLIGPILYFIVGKGENDSEDDNGEDD